MFEAICTNVLSCVVPKLGITDQYYRYSSLFFFFFSLMHYQRLFLHILVYTIVIMKRLQFFVCNGTFLRIQLEGLTWANAGWITHRSHLQIMAVLHCTQIWLPHWKNSCVIHPQSFKLKTRMVAASFQIILYHLRLSEQLIFPPSVCKTHAEIK